jgi:hypothetical protein
MSAVWKFVSYLLDQETRERIVFVTGPALRREIGNVFAPEIVPHWLGGTGRSAKDAQGVFLESGIAVDTENLTSRLAWKLDLVRSGALPHIDNFWYGDRTTQHNIFDNCSRRTVHWTPGDWRIDFPDWSHVFCWHWVFDAEQPRRASTCQNSFPIVPACRVIDEGRLFQVFTGLIAGGAVQL